MQANKPTAEALAILSGFSWFKQAKTETLGATITAQATGETPPPVNAVKKTEHDKTAEKRRLKRETHAIVNEFLDNQFDDVAESLQVEDSDKFSLTIELDL